MPKKINKYSPYDAKIIHHDHFSINQLPSDPNSPNDIFRLEHDDLKLDDYNFHDDATVDIEVKRSSQDLDSENIGTISHIKQSNKLFDFSESTGLVSVRLTITNPDQIVFSGYSKWIHPNSTQYDAWLITEAKDLGNKIWQLHISDDSYENPVLYLNSKKLDHKKLGTIIKTDATLQSTFVPQILSDILRAINVQEQSGIDDNNSWHNKCYEWALNLAQKDDSLDWDDWVDKVVDNFCEKQEYLKIFKQAFMSENNE